jgi:hypothetical protein
MIYRTGKKWISFEQAENSRHFFPGLDIEIWSKVSKLNF